VIGYNKSIILISTEKSSTNPVQEIDDLWQFLDQHNASPNNDQREDERQVDLKIAF
jgi:hypothetical protein